MPAASDDKIQIVYFSGTGGTARVAACLAQAFATRGSAVVSLSLECRRNGDPPPAAIGSSVNLLVLLYPVYAFGAPTPIHDWLARLPEGNGLRCAVLSVSGGGEIWPNTASRVSCIRRLEKRGYAVFYERMLVMPSNSISPTTAHLAVRLLEILPAKAGHCVQEILSGVRRRQRKLWTAELIAALSSMEKIGAKRFGRSLKADARCTGCGICADRCPRANIHMDGDRPRFGKSCVICLRCVYDCPAKSIAPSRLFRGLLLKEGYSLEQIEGSLWEEQPSSSTDKTGLLFAGVQKYLDRIEA